MKISKEKPLLFNQLCVGMRIRDELGNISVITKCNDKNNISVKFQSKTGGYGIYCVNNKSNRYSNLYYVGKENKNEKVVSL